MWDPPEFPRFVQVETSLRCNANCITCSNNTMMKEDIRPLDMSLDLLFMILGECSYYKKSFDTFIPFLNGEPFATKDCFSNFDIIDKNIGMGKVGLSTNGLFIGDPEKEELLCDLVLKGLRWIQFSVNGYNSLNTIMGRQAHSKIYRNLPRLIRKLVGLRESFTPRISYVLCEENKQDLKDFVDFWNNYPVQWVISPCDGRSHIYGDVDGKSKSITSASMLPCFNSLFQTLYVLTNGDVVPCCMDWKGELVLGNINSQSINEIWNGGEFNRIRDLHLQMKKSEIPICSRCKARY